MADSDGAHRDAPWRCPHAADLDLGLPLYQSRVPPSSYEIISYSEMQTQHRQRPADRVERQREPQECSVSHHEVEDSLYAARVQDRAAVPHTTTQA